MTNASVKPSLKRIEGKLDSISQRLCSMSPDCEPDDIESHPMKKSATLVDAAE